MIKVKPVILAAGKGTRFKSKKPKVIHKILGKPMLWYVIQAVKAVSPEEIVIVVGNQKEIVIEEVKKFCDNCTFAYQEEQLGTAHAVLSSLHHWKDFDGYLLIINGDTPLITAETLKRATEYLEKLVDYSKKRKKQLHIDEDIAGIILTTSLEDPYGYGRLVKDKAGIIKKIVEEKDATFEEKKIKDINSGIYLVYAPYLAEALQEVSQNNAQGEFYLTDIVEILHRKSKFFYPFYVDEPQQLQGVNDRWQLAEAEEYIQERILKSHALNGITIHNPLTIRIEPDVEIENDVEIFSGCSIKGKTRIKEGAVIYENCVISDSTIEENVEIFPNTVIENSLISKNSQVGPFARLRNNTVIGEEVSIGNFVEIKSSKIGNRTAAKHLAYIGDAEVGDNVNIGAGTITCNYDGVNKHKTVIKDNAFIGSDTMLVAPITVGKNAYTGSGSVITKDIPDDALAVERAPLKIIPDYAKRKKRKKDENC